MAFLHASIKSGNVALITGAGLGGIGYSCALILLQRGLSVILVDNSSSALSLASSALLSSGISPSQVHTREVDISSSAAMFALADEVFKTFSRLDFLMLNAGVQIPSKSFAKGPRADMDAWDKILGVNLGGVVNGTQAFVQRMVEQGTDNAVVVTGSKQGVTSPPGNPAYNVSKAAVKSITEALAYSLLDTKITAHLLIPGYTYTKLTNGNAMPQDEKKPKAAWSSEQVANELFSRMNEFYIFCPDNDVNWALDSARMKWTFDDILKKRPALSRWNPTYKDAFEAHIQAELNNNKL